MNESQNPVQIAAVVEAVKIPDILTDGTEGVTVNPFGVNLMMDAARRTQG